MAEKQAKQNRADLKAAKGKKPSKPPDKRGGGLIDRLFMRLFGAKDPPQTVQQSIPYREMRRDGICHLGGKRYSKCIQFVDITYQLAQNDVKTQIFEHFCDFLNYFDSTLHVQLSFINRYGNMEDFERAVQMPDRHDGHDESRREYSAVLRSQGAKGNNGLVKTKFVTFSLEADSHKAAKLRLERLEMDILNNFKVMGVAARPLDGRERLEILHGQFHPFGGEKFQFQWKDIPRTGLSTKDYIAPTSFDFRDKRSFAMGEAVGAVSYLQILAPELSDRMLADFLDLEGALTVNMHVQSIDQAKAIKTVKRTLSDLDKMKIEEQRKAVRSGYDMLRPDRV